MDIVSRRHDATGTLTHLVIEGDDAVLIDPVLDFDAATGVTSTETLESWRALVALRRVRVHAVLETHVHADHLSGARWWKAQLGGQVLIGRRVTEVQERFGGVPGAGFDRLVRDGEVLHLGAVTVEVRETPGHTPACVSYRVGDAVFTGDALCNPDNGVGRCDFPGGDARVLYSSIRGKLFTLPPETRVFAGHDYPVNGRGVQFSSTIGEQRAHNVQLRDGISVETFVEARAARDASLAPPRLMAPSLKANIGAAAR
ncbi:MAG: MBL fold metallo-hydrolase [Archangium gephyra]|uniref:MBL fold metallo-hydrolase n=1 Tax=Archangium gephyra TaxID=48 RepID=A0A2W5SS37_9BACT|nr:MAG: MBL fold metallo-hydrolase [Archangium gephyra]